MSQTKPNQELINAALEVADEYPVFPCDVKKRPVCQGGFKAATQDPDEIEKLFSVPNAALIGMPTGVASGLSVIDIDVRDGKQGVKWERENAELLGLTKKAKTQSGGWHYYYRHSDSLRNRAGIDGCVDISAEGGYVIHPASVGYEWLNEEEVADFPSDFAASSQAPAPAAPETLNIWGKLTDGHEAKMAEMVYVKCLDAVGDVGFDKAYKKVVSEYPDCERLVVARAESLEAEGRGQSEWEKKTRRTLAKLEREGLPTPISEPSNRAFGLYAYNQTNNTVIEVATGDEMTKDAFRTVTGRTANQDVSAGQMPVVKGTVFYPSEKIDGRIITMNGRPLFNTYPKSGVPKADPHWEV